MKWRNGAPKRAILAKAQGNRVIGGLNGGNDEIKLTNRSLVLRKFARRHAPSQQYG